MQEEEEKEEEEEEEEEEEPEENVTGLRSAAVRNVRALHFPFMYIYINFYLLSRYSYPKQLKV